MTRRALAWFPCALLLACTPSSERTAWDERRTTLQAERTELLRLEANPQETKRQLDELTARWKELDVALDVATTVRASRAPVQLFQTTNALTLTFSGSLEACRAALTSLVPARRLVPAWRLRIDGDACRWEGLGAPALMAFRAEAERAVAWVPPAASAGWSPGLSSTRDEVKALEVELGALRARLGPGAVVPELKRRVHRAEQLDAALRAADPPCDLVVVDRAALLNTDGGALLEVESSKLIHPLDASLDERLRSLVAQADGGLAWKCARVE